MHLYLLVKLGLYHIQQLYIYIYIYSLAGQPFIPPAKVLASDCTYLGYLKLISTGTWIVISLIFRIILKVFNLNFIMERHWTHPPISNLLFMKLQKMAVYCSNQKQSSFYCLPSKHLHSNSVFTNSVISCHTH